MRYQVNKNNKNIYFLSAITLLISLACNFLFPENKIANIADDFIIVSGWSSKSQTELELFLINPRTRAIQQITEGLDYGRWDIDYKVSPDCKKVLYTTYKGVFLLHLESGDVISLLEYTTFPNDWQDSYWSPSGRYIASKLLGNPSNPNSYYRILDLESNNVLAEIPIETNSSSGIFNKFGWLNDKEVLLVPSDDASNDDLYLFNIEEMNGRFIDTPNIAEQSFSISPNGKTLIIRDKNIQYSKYIATIVDGKITSPNFISLDFSEKYGKIWDAYYYTMWSPSGEYYASAMDYKIDGTEYGSLFVFTDKATFFKSLVDTEGMIIVSLVDWQPCTNYILYQIGDLWQPGNKLIAANPFTGDEVLLGYSSGGNWLLEISK